MSGTLFRSCFRLVIHIASVAFRLGAGDVELLLLRHKQFFVTPYGKGQWISVWADGPMKWQLVEELVERSYRLVALKRMIATLDGIQAQQRTNNASYNNRMERTRYG
ncbi:MAG TPA: hypothetical protein EYN66_03090 [Myxococcales bacterium]|nr:hypothetical protein [Myxococcales bacterium]